MTLRRILRAAGPASDGFTLLELLAALAIGSVVLAAVAGLIRNVGLSFEIGTRSVGNAERLLLTIERMTADLGSARYVQRSTDRGVRAVFAGGPKSLAFVSAAGVTSGTPAEEMVLLEVEEGSASTRLVRRRAPWLGPRVRADAKPGDPVVLLEGPLRISFAYAGRTPVWTDRWDDKPDLPRYVRLILRDRATGAPLLQVPEFEIRSEAPPSCARAGAAQTCIPGLGAPPAAPSAPAAARDPL
ncbi:MAG TPA: prepilin-type N-terminal cleavage/methylation domain-containing protein [Beijerinckiaceae bacterium]|jgi:prepilin-type N-terminal cleavage/methylation domain-containing protein